MARFLIATQEYALKDISKNMLGVKYSLEFWPNKGNISRKLEKIIYDLIVIDMELANGMELLESARSIQSAPVLAIGDNRTEQAVEAIKRGAYDFIAKPVSGEK